jgi:phosphatidylserine/phosphatidylglycerophosphate/cardiolipin synthase-like enzyme
MGDPYITDALAGAARRQVKVIVVMTEDSSWSDALDSLTAAGVEVRTYPDTESALYIHAKIVVVDPRRTDGRVFVGSENFSAASLLYNRELGIVTARPVIVEVLARLVASDAAAGTAWKQR